ncbi:MAG: thymidylate synthase, partial [Cyclobacteriaceae bacterium]
LDGSDNVNQLTYYAKNWENFAEDGRVIESCYGKKIFKGSDSQWNRLIDLFKNDPNSRRGVLSFYNEQNGLDAGMIDVSCTISIQFILRNKRLDAITFMRSNDLIWGIPYDVFLFTMLQELLANELEVEVGKYFHHVGSLHVYKRHYRLAEAIRDAKFNGHHKMPLMREGSNSKKFIEAESAFRNGLFLDFLSDHGYWDELANVLSSFKLKKDGRISEAKNLLNESNYKPVMEPIF